MKVVLLVLFAGCLFAQYPAVYRSLGDAIYTQAPKIERLKEIEPYTRYRAKIDSYIKEVNATKIAGFKIQRSQSGADAKSYLAKLRELEVIHNFFLYDVNGNFQASMKDRDHHLFLLLLNSGLISVQERKKEILNYYDTYKDEIQPSGVLLDLLEERKASEEKKRKNVYKQVKETEAQKIQRLRQRDKERELLLQEELEKELQEKKRKILEEQMRELAH